MTSKLREESKGLNAPLSYWEVSENELNNEINGCGPSALPSWMVPDSLLGVDVSSSCYIHDWMYHQSTKPNDFKNADNLFLENMNKQITRKVGPLGIVRKALAYIYFSAVRVYSIIKFELFKSKNN